MTFLNIIMLTGLAALSVPVLIHLLNRGKAEVMPWGAMQFLLASIASQKKRILIEELVLLALRCLIVALIALAMARPFLPSTAGVPWALILPSALGAAVCLAGAAVFWNHLRPRRTLLAAAALLLLLTVVGAFFERRLQGRRWSAGGDDRDIAVLIDASTTMRLERDGQSNFERALDEVRRIVRSARPSDAFSIHLAGATPVPLLATPTADREAIRAVLEDPGLAPAGGVMGVLEAFNAAAAALAAGRNPNKLIVLVSDGRGLGWRTDADLQWRLTADRLEELTTRPRVFFRRLGLPEGINNLSVVDLRFSPRIIGVGQPAFADITVANNGAVPARPEAVRLTVDGADAVTVTTERDILPGAREIFRMEHRFTRTGPRVVGAAIDYDDDLAADNEVARVVRVVDNIATLIVDGAPSERSLEGASDFVAIALNPRPPQRRDRFARVWSLLGRDSGDDDDDEASAATNLVATTVIPVTGLAEITDLDPYQTVVLANVSRLPADFARMLSGFVRDRNGGLLVFPGDRSDPGFYAGWRTAAGEPIIPARLVERHLTPDDPAPVDPRSFRHPALGALADAARSDIDGALANAYWELAPDAADASVRVAARFRGGRPFLVERAIGGGHVLLCAVMPHRRDGNLPALRSFVPMMHDLTHYLAEPVLPQHNIAPGSDFSMRLRADDPRVRGNLPRRRRGLRRDDYEPDTLLVSGPSGKTVPIRVDETADGMRLEFSDTYRAGLYEVAFPAGLAELYATNLFSGTNLPFAVVNNPDESVPRPLTEEELLAIGRRLDLFTADTAEDLIMAVAETVPGAEIWKRLVMLALLGMVGEVALTRWISGKRRYNAVPTLTFGEDDAADRISFKNRAENLLGSPRKPAGAKRN